jgi:hypothetical protein
MSEKVVVLKFRFSKAYFNISNSLFVDAIEGKWLPANLE